MASALEELVAEELREPVDPRVAAVGAAIAARYGDAARAVLFYGSCLRQRELGGLMLDFYLIVSDYGEAYGRGWLALANRLVPPNVFPFEHQGLVAKYAVLSEADFRRENSLEARSTSVWARFAQPSRLVWVADDDARQSVADAIAHAAPTLFALTIPTMSGEERRDPLAIFRAGFGLTYGAELRAERNARPDDLVNADRQRYERLGTRILEAFPHLGPPKRPKSDDKSDWQQGGERVRFRRSANRAWRWRQRKGKALTLVRLMKASTTFAGGIDYLAWKINRHAGTNIEVRPWQRRWPLVAALILLPRLLRRGAIR